MGKNANIGNFWHIFAILKPITTTKTLINYLFLVEEVLSFNLVCHRGGAWTAGNYFEAL